jgi:hypothetical protein
MARAKALSILSQLSQCSIRPMFDLMSTIKKMTTVPTWEVQGQLIILSNYALQELCNDKTKQSDSAMAENCELIHQTYTT